MEKILIQPCKWVKPSVFMAMTGHTINSLAKLRMNGILKEGRHYKRGPEGSQTIYYNHAAFDNLIDNTK